MTWSSIKLFATNASQWEDLPSFCQSCVNTTARHINLMVGQNGLCVPKEFLSFVITVIFPFGVGYTTLYHGGNMLGGLA